MRPIGTRQGNTGYRAMPSHSLRRENDRAWLAVAPVQPTRRCTCQPLHLLLCPYVWQISTLWPRLMPGYSRKLPGLDLILMEIDDAAEYRAVRWPPDGKVFGFSLAVWCFGKFFVFLFFFFVLFCFVFYDQADLTSERMDVVRITRKIDHHGSLFTSKFTLTNFSRKHPSFYGSCTMLQSFSFNSFFIS